MKKIVLSSQDGMLAIYETKKDNYNLFVKGVIIKCINLDAAIIAFNVLRNESEYLF